ncbi:MAG: hypothetical protein Q8Q09_04970 [Deltaproteobacteria bacterium]|nr:hypothetical protein [Deltaproteobacteria bacterium]
MARSAWDRGLRSAAVLAVFGVVLFAANAPASIEEQRARLPPPARCEDPVEGEWRGKKWEPSYQNWFAVTLDVHRASPGSSQLQGTITARVWYATERDVEPPQCSPRVLRDYTVEMPASGSAQGLQIRFGSSQYRVVATHCGRFNSYNPDNFSGTIDAAIQEFQSVNNDGGRAVNDPMVFRRVRCFEPGERAQRANTPAVVVAPPLMPPGRARGCSLN